jgi:hypothetical protein
MDKGKVREGEKVKLRDRESERQKEFICGWERERMSCYPTMARQNWP